MSEGLRFLGAVIETGSRAALSAAGDELFNENELAAVEIVRNHVRRYGEMPSRQTVNADAGVVIPAPRENVAFYEDRLRDRFTFNSIRDRLDEFQQAFRARSIEGVVTAVGHMHQAARSHNRRDRQMLNIAEAGQLVMDRLERTRFMGGITGIPTGWNNFDQMTGGSQDSDIITYVARPGIGKTYVLLKQAHHCHQVERKSTLVVTTEMGIEQLARRYASIGLGIDPQALKQNTISTYTHRRLRQFYNSMVDADGLRFFAIGMDSRVAAVEALCQEFMPDIVMIDGVYLLKPNHVSRNANRTEQITGVFDDLKALNLELNKPLVVSTQFNRAAGKGGKDGSLETIGYSDAIGTHSSVVVGLKEGPTENPRHSRLFDILKGREGEHGEYAINFRFAPLDMSEIPFNPETGMQETGEPASTDWMD